MLIPMSIEGPKLIARRGPNWIHGAGENPILDIANATGTAVHDFEGGQLVLTSDGAVMDDRVSEKISDILWTIIQEAFNYSNTHQDDIPAEKSLLDFIRERLEKTDVSAEEKSLVIESSRLWGAYVGDPVDKQSLKFFNLEESIDGSMSSILVTQLKDSLLTDQPTTSSHRHTKTSSNESQAPLYNTQTSA